MQQWYQHYQAAQAHTYSTAAPPDATSADYSKDHTQVTHTASNVNALMLLSNLKIMYELFPLYFRLPRCPPMVTIIPTCRL